MADRKSGAAARNLRVLAKGVFVAVAGAAAVLGAATLITLIPQVQGFLDFGAGVISLLALTGAVMWGLVTTNRSVLYPDHRLWAQRIHRVLAVGGLGFLILHIWIKVQRDSVLPSAAVIPFVDPTQPVLIGLGSLAGYAFVAVAATGAARSRFTSTRGSLIWRAIHMSAYLAWGAALVHGLKAGRQALPGVDPAYAAAVLVVVVGLVLKLKTKGALVTRRQNPKAATAPSQPPGSPTTPRIPTPTAPSNPENTGRRDGQASARRLTFERQRP